MKLRSIALAAGLCLLASACLAERPRIYALKDARIVVAPGKVIPKGNVIIRDGLIVAAGANAAIPPDAVEIDASGKTVYAGLIDAQTTLGIRRTQAATPAGGGGRGGNQLAALLAAATPAAPTPGANHPIARIHPETEARNLIAPFEPPAPTAAAAGGAGAAAAVTDAERYREIGFTTVLVEPDSGIFRGTSAVIDLRDSTPTTHLIVKELVAQHIALEMRGGFGGGYPGSMMGVIASIRQAFIDAERYRTWKQRYATNPAGMKRPEYSSSFEALGPVLGGARMVIFDTEAAEDILAADRIVREFQLKNVIMGADNNVSEELARVKATGYKLIVSANLPAKPRVDDPDDANEVDLRDLRRFVNAPMNAKKLYDAKIPFVLSSRGVTTVADFPRNIKRMIDAGLPADVALAKLTIEPAEWLGLSALMGTVEAGKLANLIVTDGDLFGPNTHVVRVYVDGIEYINAPPPARPAGGGPGGATRPPAEEGGN